MKKFSVRKLALLLFEKGIIPQPDVATGRNTFWAHFGHEKPTQIIVTDGATYQHPEKAKMGVMKYRVVDDPTYALIVERDEARARWIIIYAYFFHPHRLRANKLMHELRLFAGIDLQQGELEQLFATALQHDKHHP